MTNKKILRDPLTGEQFLQHRADQKYANPENQQKAATARSNAKKKQCWALDKPKRVANSAGLKILNGRRIAMVTAEFARGCGLAIEEVEMISKGGRSVVLYDVRYVFISEKLVMVSRLNNSTEAIEPKKTNRFEDQDAVERACSLLNITHHR